MDSSFILVLTIYVVGHMEGLGSRRLEPGTVSTAGRVRFEFSKVASQVFRLIGKPKLGLVITTD